MLYIIFSFVLYVNSKTEGSSFPNFIKHSFLEKYTIPTLLTGEVHLNISTNNITFFGTQLALSLIHVFERESSVIELFQKFYKTSHYINEISNKKPNLLGTR